MSKIHRGEADLGYITNVDRVLIFDFKIFKGVKMNFKVEETLFYTLYPREKFHISGRRPYNRDTYAIIKMNFKMVLKFLIGLCP